MNVYCIFYGAFPIVLQNGFCCQIPQLFSAFLCSCQTVPISGINQWFVGVLTHIRCCRLCAQNNCLIVVFVGLIWRVVLECWMQARWNAWLQPLRIWRIYSSHTYCFLVGNRIPCFQNIKSFVSNDRYWLRPT